jgi:hypothetical protein
MNFTLKVKESTHIFSIKNILRDRHGRMDDLKICFKAFTESNEVKNDMLTLLGTSNPIFQPLYGLVWVMQIMIGAEIGLGLV